MRQKQSNWTSLVLFALVGLSLFLTYRILAYPGNPAASQTIARPAATPDSQSVVSTKSVEDVFVPYQLVLHTHSGIFLSQNPEVTKTVNAFLSEWRLADVAFQEEYSYEAYQQLVEREGMVEVNFPRPVPLELISRYFAAMPEELYDDIVNRILIPTNPEESVYLVHDRSRNVYTAVRPEASMNPLINLYAENPERFITAEIFRFQDSMGYLPIGEMAQQKLFYLAERQSNSFFINQLFEDTTELKDNSDDYVTSYSDNISELRIHKQTGLFYYYRNNLDTTPVPVYQQIRNSFHEMKFLDNWTNQTLFHGYNSQTGEIRYRRYVNGLPIIGTPDMGLTRIKMANSGPVEIQFSTQIIQTPLQERQETVLLPGANEVIAELQANGYAPSSIQGMQIAYEWKNSPESDRIVELNPSWYIEMGDSWKTVEAWLDDMKGDAEIGL